MDVLYSTRQSGPYHIVDQDNCVRYLGNVSQYREKKGFHPDSTERIYCA